jgi:hypothetical protein
MMPTLVKEQAPVPPPCYQRAQVKRGPALHIDALTLVTTLHLLASGGTNASSFDHIPWFKPIAVRFQALPVQLFTVMTPSWFGEVTLLTRYLRKHDVLIKKTRNKSLIAGVVTAQAVKRHGKSWLNGCGTCVWNWVICFNLTHEFAPAIAPPPPHTAPTSGYASPEVASP